MPRSRRSVKSNEGSIRTRQYLNRYSEEAIDFPSKTINLPSKIIQSLVDWSNDFSNNSTYVGKVGGCITLMDVGVTELVHI